MITNPRCERTTHLKSHPPFPGAAFLPCWNDSWFPQTTLSAHSSVMKKHLVELVKQSLAVLSGMFVDSCCQAQPRISAVHILQIESVINTNCTCKGRVRTKIRIINSSSKQKKLFQFGIQMFYSHFRDSQKVGYRLSKVWSETKKLAEIIENGKITKELIKK